MKHCKDCDLNKPLDLFSNDKNRTDGKYVYCKACVKKRSRKRYLKNSEAINAKNKAWKEENKETYLAQQRAYSKVYSQTFDGRYGHYKNGTAAKKYGWELDKELFESFWQKDCHYCGDSIDTVGIDRADSSIGYRLDNVVSCCETCNKIKLHHETEFLKEHMQKMLNRQGEW